MGGEARNPGEPTAPAVPKLSIVPVDTAAPGAYVATFKVREENLRPLTQGLRRNLVVARQLDPTLKNGALKRFDSDGKYIWRGSIVGTKPKSAPVGKPLIYIYGRSTYCSSKLIFKKLTADVYVISLQLQTQK